MPLFAGSRWSRSPACFWGPVSGPLLRGTEVLFSVGETVANACFDGCRLLYAAPG